MALVFKNVGENSTAKNYRPVRLPTVDSNLNNRLVDHGKKSGLYSDFHHRFKSSCAIVDLLTVVSDRLARAFDRSRTFEAVALDISKGFHRVWHAGLLHKLISDGISGWLFRFILSFLRNNRLRLDLDGKSLQEYSVNVAVPQSSILVPTQFLLQINDFADDRICNIAIYAGDSNLYSKCDQASDVK